MSTEQTNDFTHEEILDCRKRCNPYEAISKAFFVNRAATKFANLDAMFKFSRPPMRPAKPIKASKPAKPIKTKPTKNFKDIKQPDHKRNIEADDEDEEMLTFIDINGGPGGFVDYLMWRRGWQVSLWWM